MPASRQEEHPDKSEPSVDGVLWSQSDRLRISKSGYPLKKINIYNINIYIYLEPICPSFWLQNKVFSNQNKGHLASRYYRKRHSLLWRYGNASLVPCSPRRALGISFLVSKFPSATIGETLNPTVGEIMGFPSFFLPIFFGFFFKWRKLDQTSPTCSISPNISHCETNISPSIFG